MVRVEVKEGVPVDGLKMAETPYGSPVAERVVCSAVPERRVVVIVIAAVWPCEMAKLVGVSVIPKPGRRITEPSAMVLSARRNSSGSGGIVALIW